MSSARISGLKVKNFRVLHDVRFESLTSFTTLLGPNSCGKSTVLDVLAFLRDCFENDIGKAWRNRGGMEHVRSRGKSGNVEIEIEVTFGDSKYPVTTYSISIDEENGEPIVEHEKMFWENRAGSSPIPVIQMKKGIGSILQEPNKSGGRTSATLEIELSSDSSLAAPVLRQFKEYTFFKFFGSQILGLFVTSISVDAAKGQVPMSKEVRLNQSGDNIANVVHSLSSTETDVLEEIYKSIRKRVPAFGKFASESTPAGGVVLKVHDEPFSEPTLARFASNGLLKILAYFLILSDASSHSCICFEEPENHLHPKLVSFFTEECRAKSTYSQIMLTTHSPHFLNDMKREDVWIIWRGTDGFANVKRVSDIDLLNGFDEADTALGELWIEGHFGVGNPADFRSRQFSKDSSSSDSTRHND